MSPASPSPAELAPLIARYREGSAEAAGQLLEQFQPYLARWYRLLTTGRFRQEDAELTHFLRMLMGGLDPVSAGRIVARRLRAYEPVDLSQELQVVLLETAREEDGIADRFRYRLKDRIQALLMDPAVFHYDRIPLR